MSILIAAILSFLITTLFGHVVHWSLHQTWTGAIHRSHMAHHLRLYPPSDFFSEAYRSAGKDSSPKFFIISGLPIILAPVVLWFFGFLSLPVMITILVVEGLVGWSHDYFHDAFHIKDHWLYRVYAIRRLFTRWVALHYLHHVNMQANFGIVSFLWDRIFGTYTNSVATKLE